MGGEGGHEEEGNDGEDEGELEEGGEHCGLVGGWVDWCKEGVGEGEG